MVEIIADQKGAESPQPQLIPAYWNELPPGLVDLRNACQDYGRSRSTISGWLSSGRLPVTAVLFHDHGISKVVREEDIVALVEETADRKVRRFTAIPKGFLTLDDAAAKYDISGNTLRGWVKAGHISVAGQLMRPGQTTRTNLCSDEEIANFLAKKGKLP